MNNNEPNKIVSALFKRWLKLHEVKVSANFDYPAQEQLKKELCNITTAVGAIEVMSKNSILKLLKMGSSTRFMQPFQLLMYCAKAADDIFNIPE